MEPSWSLNWDRSIGEYCDTIFIHDKLLLTGQRVIEHPSLLLYHMPEEITYFTKNNYKKNKKISFIVRNGYYGTELYNFRNALARDLVRHDIDVDIFGYGWRPHKNIKGEVTNKKDALEDYMFSICIENSSEKNYTTEKFHDCLLCNTIPIYLGAPNINDIYDSTGFITLDKNNTIDQIKELTSCAPYELYKTGMIKNKEKYINQFNIYNIIKKELE
jgi:hypothetical protein